MLRFLLVVAVLPAVAEPFRYYTAPKDQALARLESVPRTNAERGETLHRLLAEAGCPQNNLERPAVKSSKIPNVSCTLPGPLPGLIVVMAHFDKVESGEGLIDNWSGASLLPSLLQGLKMGETRHTILFLGTTDEEKGLVGAKAWVKANAKTLLPQVRAVVNIDSLGTGPTRVWLSRAHKGMAATANGLAAALQIPFSAINVDKVGDTDSHPFADKKIPCIDFHSLTQETWQLLHSDSDNKRNFRTEDWLASQRLLSAYLAYLDANLDDILATRPAKATGEKVRSKP